MCKYIAMLLLVVCGWGCSRSNFPPSNYVGISNRMNGHVNGELPGTDRNYTGYWQDTYANGNIAAEGTYRNGIPVDYWKHYYINGAVRCSWTYYPDGTAEAIDYFPDGMPRTADQFAYCFGDDRYTLKKIKPTKYWGFDGDSVSSELVPCFFWRTIPGPRECGYAWPWTLDREYSLAPFIDAWENRFQLKIFLIPSAKRTTGEILQSFRVEGRWNPETQEAEDITVLPAGKFSLQYKAARPPQGDDNMLWLDFEIPELPSPVNFLSVGIVMKGPR